mmetsp:Transcript_71039/g.217729  ORF Transcript_71039/g.217729 Transcript_71039/m.217729 type:complete len:232 (+) Transcript_71039:98-793(+)
MPPLPLPQFSLHLLLAWREQTHAKPSGEEAVRIHLRPVSLELCLGVVAIDFARETVGKGLHLAVGAFLEAPKLADVRPRTKRLKPMVLNPLEGRLPTLIVAADIREGQELAVEVRPWGDRLQLRGVAHGEEAELAWLIPLEPILAAFQAVQLLLPQKIHCLERLVGAHKPCRNEGDRRLRQPEAIIHQVAQSLHQHRRLGKSGVRQYFGHQRRADRAVGDFADSFQNGIDG